MGYYKAKIPWIIKKVTPIVTYTVPVKEPAIFLTFDDGPCKETTPQILDLLEKHNAKATFFCVGNNVRKLPHLFEKIKSKGHSVGNHTYNHKNGWSTKNKQYFEDIKQANNFIRSNLFRPPYGRIKPSQIYHLNKKYKIIMWDVLSGDFDPNTSKDKCLKNIITNAESGSIIVFHDSLKAKNKMLYSLEETLKYFGNLNYKFKTIYTKTK